MSEERRKCPKCDRNLIKQRIRNISLSWTPKYKGTLLYFKCRVCFYRESADKLVFTRPGGKRAE